MRPVQVSTEVPITPDRRCSTAAALPASSNSHFAIGAHGAQHWHTAPDIFPQVIEIQIESGLYGVGLQMLDRIDRSRHCQNQRGGIAERLPGENLARFGVQISSGRLFIRMLVSHE